MPHPACVIRRATDPPLDLEALFLVLVDGEDDLFWLDAGTDAGEGWSFLGVGYADPDGPGAVVLGDPEAGAGPPLCDGWVGWLDYESGAAVSGAPVSDSADAPAWVRLRAAIAVDHASGEIWALGDRQTVDGWIAASAQNSAQARSESEAVRVAVARHAPDEYAALIEDCRDAIRAGDAYLLCLTTRFSVPGAHDPAAVYRRLRRASPSHHGGFLRIGGRALLSASPETFLRTKGNRIVTRPIKGTRPRGRDAASDIAFAEELLASAKERAENVMIVDLMRNDLSRICEPGTVRVDGLWQIESYPAVHQLVSTVSGRLATGTTVRRLQRAVFPAGSMTGAPKLSAMTVLNRLERAPRGVYSGCFGYIGVDGAVDLAMVIRSIVIDTEGAVVGAGGGITWGSLAADEVAEVATKARAPLAALGAELPDTWRG
ncbi:aminodeoxychorismate synthase component I [uncultured Microbacterium sp.]|uniref:aminodeoxychorismate synthase component I n=1 Tax=uncultured Microbacterium sp. TaxID=191216 RepID=UPI002603999E|nr:aminodeoxychorismate synthase component I [uncultured Microbacterium sp.]